MSKRNNTPQNFIIGSMDDYLKAALSGATSTNTDAIYKRQRRDTGMDTSSIFHFSAGNSNSAHTNGSTHSHPSLKVDIHHISNNHKNSSGIKLDSTNVFNYSHFSRKLDRDSKDENLATKAFIDLTVEDEDDGEGCGEKGEPNERQVKDEYGDDDNGQLNTNDRKGVMAAAFSQSDYQSRLELYHQQHLTDANPSNSTSTTAVPAPASIQPQKSQQQQQLGRVYWQIWCNEQRFQDADRVTAQKLIHYVDKYVLTATTLERVWDYVLPILQIQVEQELTTQIQTDTHPVTKTRPRASLTSTLDQHVLPTPIVAPGSGSRSSMAAVQKQRLDRAPITDQALAALNSLLVKQRAEAFSITTREDFPHVLTNSSGGNNASSGHATPIPPLFVDTRLLAREFILFPEQHQYQRHGKGKENNSAIGHNMNDERLTSLYRLKTDLVSVREVLTEWRHGLEGRPSVQGLNAEGASWRHPEDKVEYAGRLVIVQEFIYLVLKKGMTEREAIKTLEGFLVCQGSFQRLYKSIRTHQGLRPVNWKKEMKTMLVPASR